MPYQKIEDTAIFLLACEVGDAIYEIVQGWQGLPKETIGMQWIRAADSVGANLVEGDARFTDRDSARFFDYALGSCREALFWLHRAKQRKLIGPEESSELENKILELSGMSLGLRNYRRKLVQTLRARESNDTEYNSGSEDR